MARSNAKGATFFSEGTQNQQILANFWGTGKTFTMNDSRNDLDIAHAARLLELKEAGFNVKAKAVDPGAVGRLKWNIPSKKKSIIFIELGRS